MVTVIRIDMSEDMRLRLGKHLTGKSKPATRKNIEKWAAEKLFSELERLMEEDCAPAAPR